MSFRFIEYMNIYIHKYISEIHTSNIIIVKNNKADVNSTGFIFQSSVFNQSSWRTPTLQLKKSDDWPFIDTID